MFDVLAVHYASASDAEAKAEFERRGYTVTRIGRVIPKMDCNEARGKVRDMQRQGQSRFYEYEGPMDVSVGCPCSIWGFDGGYNGEPIGAPYGAPSDGFGRGARW